MMLNGHIRADNVYGVLVDDQQSFYEGTKKLIEDGRKQILFLYREQTASESKKFEGYKQALQEAGIPFDEKLVLGINKRINGVRRGVEAAWKEGLRFDGVMACEDEQAAAALKFLLQEGVHIPEDVAIIGCNNSVLSICTEPDLTTIDNKSVVMCENLVSTLMMVLNGMSPSHKQTIEADLIVRRTTR
jgi:LacI family transcriptional regulator/LacI family asc operon transcriptional repressor